MNRERVILHSDGNCFYANCEMRLNSKLRNVPLVVGGDAEARRGIVLAKNDIAKKYKIVTAETIGSAKRKCPGLVVIPANYELYTKYSNLLRELYLEYTDQVEPFGLDESWMDVTHSAHLFGTGPEIADTIRERVKRELGITVSIGVSYNKIFAKLGSDMKKPDATTVITSKDYKQKVWPLPAGDLIYVGGATQRSLKRVGIETIGQIAKADPKVLNGLLGKWGAMLWMFANGEDKNTVKTKHEHGAIKSIGNSTTTPRDLISEDDVKIMLYLMAESVASRLRESGLLCRTVQIGVRGNDFSYYQLQGTLPFPCQDSNMIFELAYRLFYKKKARPPVRCLGVRASNLLEDCVTQLSLFDDITKTYKHEAAERAVDSIRRRFGFYSVRRGIMHTDTLLSGINPKDEHNIYPVAYM